MAENRIKRDHEPEIRQLANAHGNARRYYLRQSHKTVTSSDGFVYLCRVRQTLLTSLPNYARVGSLLRQKITHEYALTDKDERFEGNILHWWFIAL